jgi:hypothetical protein
MSVRSITLALCSLALLGGCALIEELAPTPSSPAQPQATKPVAEAVEIPIPTAKPVPPLQAALPPASTPAAPTAPPSGTVAVIEPARLEQLTPEQTVALFGEPSIRAERGSGVVWSYVRPGCELDLLFFVNVQTRVSRVLDYDLRTGDGSDRSRRLCLEQLALERRNRDSGSSSSPR